MNTLMTRNLQTFPMRDVPTLLDELDDLLQSEQTDTTNALSVSEDNKHVHIEAALPGIEPDDVEVTFDRGMLWIRGVAHEEEKDKKRKFYRRAARAFSYRVAVPGEIDQNTTPEAEMKNGMIMITFSKVPSAMPKRITVKHGKSNGEKKAKAN